MAGVPLILVADNDPDVSAMLSDVLRLHGARTEVVPDGRGAVARLQRGDIDLLVCDLDMPNIDGLGVIQALPACPSPPPVMVVSGFVDDATLTRLRQSPYVCAVLRKPFDVIEFAQRACAVAVESRARGGSYTSSAEP